jgi:hypothetical protein
MHTRLRGWLCGGGDGAADVVMSLVENKEVFLKWELLQQLW